MALAAMKQFPERVQVSTFVLPPQIDDSTEQLELQSIF